MGDDVRGSSGSGSGSSAHPAPSTQHPANSQDRVHGSQSGFRIPAGLNGLSLSASSPAIAPGGRDKGAPLEGSPAKPRRAAEATAVGEAGRFSTAARRAAAEAAKPGHKSLKLLS
jgi:hypothetical protein